MMGIVKSTIEAIIKIIKFVCASKNRFELVSLTIEKKKKRLGELLLLLLLLLQRLLK